MRHQPYHNILMQKEMGHMQKAYGHMLKDIRQVHMGITPMQKEAKLQQEKRRSGQLLLHMLLILKGCHQMH
jgi:hypothetical protein